MESRSQTPETSQSDLHPQLGPAERARIVEILRQFGITQAALFGSFARGDTHATSDVDVLVSPLPGTTLLDLARPCSTSRG